MDANYPAYLQSIYPDTTWTVQKLTGGIVNSTLRASRIAGPDVAPKSVVLKHARPYIQSAGPGFSFSTKRQVGRLTSARYTCPDLTETGRGSNSSLFVG